MASISASSGPPQRSSGGGARGKGQKAATFSSKAGSGSHASGTSTTGRASTTGKVRAASKAMPRIVALDSPVMSYYLLLGSALVLLTLGLAMVLSSSMIFSLKETGGTSALADFTSQAKFALMALPLAAILSRLKLTWLEALAWPAVFLGIALQALLLVPSLQRSQGGNSAWISLGGITMQPSEFAKLALAIWLGAVLGKKGALLSKWRHIILPAGLGIFLYLVLVMVGQDLGTALIFAILAAGALVVAGVPFSKLSLLGALGGGAIAFYVFSSSNRLQRVLMKFSGGEALDPQGAGLQPLRALEALGTGGLSGVGLGASRNKWLYLPESHNDYIFAIIGEELGLFGATLVVLLFVVLAYAITRLVKRHESRFAKITAGAIGAWIIGQAFVNILVVVNIAPVIGVPLPLVSSGGSSLIATMLAIGVLLAIARSEPGAPEYFAARPGVVKRSVASLRRGGK